MIRRFGDRSTFAVEIGAFWSAQLRVVDLWAAGKRLTVDDNTVFLPAFCLAVRSTAAAVRLHAVPPCPFPGRSPEDIYRLLEKGEAEFRERYWFMQWGETVDNVSTRAFLDDELVIMFSFWRPTHPYPAERHRVFVARVPPGDFVTAVETAADLLEAEGPQPSSAVR